MRVLHINSFGNLSTGKAMVENHRRCVSKGHKSVVAYARGTAPQDVPSIVIGNRADRYAHALGTRFTDRTGFYSRKATLGLLDEIRAYDPQVIHLHNLHGYYVNIELLFNYLANEFGGHVYWTLHDCWSFTGHCPHFSFAQCTQWKDGSDCAGPCPQLGVYPKTHSGRNTARNFADKKRLFTALPADRLTLITPSQWLADLVGESFLSKYPVEVRRNTIDTKLFRPTESDFRARSGVGERFMILGVASTWGPRKGLDVFQELFGRLNPAKYAIVLVGLSTKQLKRLPAGMVGYERTNSPQELVEIYSAADVFFNPTTEDNYPTVNLEAEACGTPVATFDTGGCKETIKMPQSSVVDGLDGFLAYLGGLRRE